MRVLVSHAYIVYAHVHLYDMFSPIVLNNSRVVTIMLQC